MEFWGIEVKPGETAKVNPGDDYYLHVSQVALGETKKEKGNENIPIFLKYDNQKLVIGTLSAEKCAQIQFDFVFEKEFELSHSSKSASIYFCGYKTLAVEDDGEGFDDEFDQSESDEEEEDIELVQKANGKPDAKAKPEPNTQKDLLAAKAKPKSGEPKKDDKQKTAGDDEDDDSDDEDEEDSSDEDDLDEEMDDLDDDDDDSEDESDDEDEATPVKVEQSKKRSASASKTPVPEKKAKLLSPVGNQKSGDAGKKVAHPATPHPAKQGGKDKSAQKSPKSGGSISCKSCSKTFGSDNALQAHSKAKHGDGK